MATDEARVLDGLVRLAAFRFLEDELEKEGEETLPFRLLRDGFTFRGRRVPLLGPQGIFKPAVLPELPLTITTAPPKEGKEPPYDDVLASDGLLRYRYRGTDPNHRDNVGLRKAMERQVPLVYLKGIVPGRYLPAWPAYIVGDDPDRLTFTAAIDHEIVGLSGPAEPPDRVAEARRAYATVETLRRIHQQKFRERVLRAYRECCAVCRLRHRELLDATHILPDRHPRGDPVVPNGIALCKLHHAAFDRNILGIRPDLEIDIRVDVLTEADGPMLRHGLQGFQGSRLIVPRRPENRPDPDRLAERYELFREAGAA